MNVGNETNTGSETRLEENFTLEKVIFKKYPSVSAFCAAHDELGRKSEQRIGALLNCKASPWKQDGSFRRMCIVLEQILKIPAEYLFPDHLYESVDARKNKESPSTFSDLPVAVRNQVRQCVAHGEHGMEPATLMDRRKLFERLDMVINSLTYRQREVIKLRMGIGVDHSHTLVEVGDIFKVTPDKVRQIEASAIMKLRHPVRSRMLEDFVY